MKTWLLQHSSTLGRTLAKLVRSPVATILNMLVVGIALALPGGLYLGLVNVQNAVRSVSPEPQLTLFMAIDANRTDVSEIDSRLKRDPEVARIRYVSRERALEDLKRTSGMGGVVDALERNPLPDAFVIDASDPAPDAMERLRAKLADWPKVAHVQLDAEWAQRLDAALRAGRIALLLLGTILGFALVAITFNTIRLQVLTQREEIEVAALIGATPGYIRRPFLYYGAMLGILGGGLACGFIYLAVNLLNGALADLSTLYGSTWALQPLSTQDGVSLLAFAAALAWTGAWLAVGRHLARLEAS